MSKPPKRHPKTKRKPNASVSFQSLQTTSMLLFLGGFWLILIVIATTAIGQLTNPLASKRSSSPSRTEDVTSSQAETQNPVASPETTPSPESVQKTDSPGKGGQDQPFPLWLVGGVVLGCAAGSLGVTYGLRRLASYHNQNQSRKRKVLPKKHDPDSIIEFYDPSVSPQYPYPQNQVSFENKLLKLSENNLQASPIPQNEVSFDDSPIKSPPLSASGKPYPKLSDQLRVKRSSQSQQRKKPKGKAKPELKAELSPELPDYPRLLPTAEENPQPSPQSQIIPPENSGSGDRPQSQPKIIEMMDLRKQHRLP
jgi:hypothetical protein